MTQNRIPSVVVYAGLLIAISMGIRQSFGLFLEPLTLSLGIDRETYSLAIAWQNLLLALPLIGILADRYGFRVMAFTGSIIYALGLGLLAQTGSSWELYLELGLLVGIGQGLTGYIIVLGAVGQSVQAEKRTTALGWTTAAGSFGMFALIPACQWLLNRYEWSGALLVLVVPSVGMMLLAFGLPGRYKVNKSENLFPENKLSLGQVFKQAFSHSGYWLLNAGFFVCGFHVAFIATHMPAFLRDEQVSPDFSAYALSMIGLFNIFGSLLFGHLGDRYSKKNLLSLLYFLRAAVIVVFLTNPINDITAVLFGGVIGFLWLATVPLTSGLVGHFFGVRYLSSLYAVVFFSHQIGAFLGVWWGGRAYDVSGSYDIVWLAAVGLGLFAAVIHLPIRESPVLQPLQAEVLRD